MINDRSFAFRYGAVKWENTAATYEKKRTAVSHSTCRYRRTSASIANFTLYDIFWPLPCDVAIAGFYCSIDENILSMAVINTN